MELKREQIIKALELHSQKAKPCLQDCPYGGLNYCGSAMARDALSLINELTERNEQLRGVKEEYETFIGGLKPKIDEIKADTLSEFKNRLTREVGTYLSISIMKVSDMFKLIDKNAKEMLEGV